MPINNFYKMDKTKDLFVVRATSTEKDEYVVTLGSKLASEQKFKTSKAAQQYIESKPYELIMALCFASIEAWEASKADSEKKTEETTTNKEG